MHIPFKLKEMSRPAWLPPLNSHENYGIIIGMHQLNIAQSTRSQKFKCLCINLIVRVQFYSDDVQKNYPSFEGLRLYHKLVNLEVPASEVDLREYVDSVLRNRAYVPFKLDKIELYRETDELEPALDQTSHDCNGQRELVDRVADFLFRILAQCGQMGRSKVATVLLVEKRVTITNQEYEAWTSWYHEQRRANPGDFNKEYLEAIRVPRTPDELWYESSLLAYESAAKSCIESLEKLAPDEVGEFETKSCRICLDDLAKGDQTVKLPCAHLFHGDCVVQWLKTSHFCPLCRYMLPTS